MKTPSLQNPTKGHPAAPAIEEMFAFPSGPQMPALLTTFCPARKRAAKDFSTQKMGMRKSPRTGTHEAVVRVRWKLADTAKTSASVSAQALESDLQSGGLHVLGKEVLRAFGAQGLRHLCAFLIALHANFHAGWFVFDTDDVLDRCGYARRQVGGHSYHHPENVRRARTIARMLASLAVEITRQSGGGQERLSIRLFAVWANMESYHTQQVDWQKGDPPATEALQEPVREQMVIGANPLWYGAVMQRNRSKEKQVRSYTWQLKQLAQEDARQHGLTLLLGLLLPVKFRMKQGKPIRVKAGGLMCWAGLAPCGRRRMHGLKKLKSELDYMVRKGYLGGWRVISGSKGGPFDDVFELAPPDWLSHHLARIQQPCSLTPIKPKALPPAPALQPQEIKQIRKAAGLGLRVFAKGLGCSPSLISQIEGGERRLSPALANKILNWQARRCSQS